MDLDDHRLISVLSQELHIGRTAERLHVSPANVSQRLSALERQLGTAIAHRTTRSVELTDFGAWLRTESDALLAVAEASDRRIRDAATGVRGRLRLSFIGSVGARLLPQLVRALHARMPDVSLEIGSQAFTGQIERHLLTGACDIGVLRTPISSDALDTRVLFEDPLMAVVPAAHPLANADVVRPEHLRAETLVCFPEGEGSVVAAQVAALTAAAGFTPDRRMEAAETSTLVGMVAAGLGIALLPRSTRALAIPGVTYVELAGAWPSEVVIAWRRGEADPVVARFVALMEAGELWRQRDTATDAPRSDVEASAGDGPQPGVGAPASPGDATSP